MRRGFFILKKGNTMTKTTVNQPLFLGLDLAGDIISKERRSARIDLLEQLDRRLDELELHGDEREQILIRLRHWVSSRKAMTDVTTQDAKPC
ncbi:Uncharacterised protein [Serratia ficaria]|nr:Uncharacterised protein [Serratia ficaria]CAI1566260.1 Uncharacterised protein [Serratia ficaria]CAI2404346.1 Uncharacterised protein [Serratia ficaria]CAI2430555.1 Uncharacterised protein [Serratia ficaria]